jgi:hypothetical protein
MVDGLETSDSWVGRLEGRGFTGCRRHTAWRQPYVPRELWEPKYRHDFTGIPLLVAVFHIRIP